MHEAASWYFLSVSGVCVCVCVFCNFVGMCVVCMFSSLCVYECVPVCAFCTITQQVLIFYTVPGVRAHLEGALCRGGKHDLMIFHLLLVSFRAAYHCFDLKPL